MELILQIILEFFLEFVVQIVGEVFLEIGFQKLSAAPWARKALNATLAVLMYFGLGLIIGGFSILIFPHSFIRSSRLHGISLIITPLLAGLTMSGIGWWRERHGKPVIRLDTFAYGFIFAFGVALVRFLFTT
jgi:hypothetical protein